MAMHFSENEFTKEFSK